MWAIVAGRAGEYYVGLLESEPATLEPDPVLRPGIEFLFGPEHVIDIDTPPLEYVRRKYPDRIAFREAGGSRQQEG